MELHQLLRQYAPLPTPILEELIEGASLEEYPKNYFLLKEDKICRQVWILVSGAAKFFIVDPTGKPINVWFAFEKEVITSIHSFNSQLPSRENIQLIEDSRFLSISYDRIQTLLERHHSFALWYLELLKKTYVPLIEERLFDLQFLSAQERYDKLLQTRADILQRVSLGNIASYLNISQETLSRIRGRKR